VKIRVFPHLWEWEGVRYEIQAKQNNSYMCLIYDAFQGPKMREKEREREREEEEREVIYSKIWRNNSWPS
jgi:hypothetical protein